MEVLNFKEYENEDFFRRIYTLSDNVQVDNFCNVIKGFENNDTKMLVCNCQSFDETGHPLHRRYTSVEDIIQANGLPNPYIRFYLEFGDRLSGVYKFNLEANVNSNLLSYIVDKKKLTVESKKRSGR